MVSTAASVPSESTQAPTIVETEPPHQWETGYIGPWHLAGRCPEQPDACLEIAAGRDVR